ncbi:MAG TPA: endonuclease/exonuclease/phosphatase family protein [Solirubrobacterales bacterium]|nr:endonuclease/exonuclease/phosphatase family protein [Solirubrobacterales bacterium]
MDIRVGTFNLNNLFSRFNLYTEADPQIRSDSEEATKEKPRPWLSSGPATPPTEGEELEIVSRGVIGPDGKLQWRRMFKGKLVRAKDPKAQKTLAERIKALDVDVLCVQEVENLDALEDFVKFFRLNDEGFEHLSLVEGNDKRLIDVGVISKLPLGEVSSWRHRTHPDDPAETVFSRDLLQVEILEPKDRQPVLTVYVNHLKSQLADDEEEVRKNDRRRQRQAESIASIIEENPPGTPYLVVGDMNDTPDSPPLSALEEKAKLFDALAKAEERGGPYPEGDPTPPPDRPWTHRYRGDGKTSYELYDQIWASPDLRDKVGEAWILRRTLRGGNASDHDPAAVELKGLS